MNAKTQEIQVQESVSSSPPLSLPATLPLPHFLYLLFLLLTCSPSSSPLPAFCVHFLSLHLSPYTFLSFPSFLQNRRVPAPDLLPYYLFQTWLPRSFVARSSLCISFIWILNSQSTRCCSKYHLQPESFFATSAQKNQFPQGLTLMLISQLTGVSPCT